jgi:hypothetical protein
MVIEASCDKVNADSLSEGYHYGYDPVEDPGECFFLGHGRVNAWKAMQITPLPGGGVGCPYLACWTGESFALDNNLLPLSEYLPGDPPYSTDHYKLIQRLAADEERYRLEVREFEQEQGFFDWVNLLRVDHSPSVGVAVAQDERLAKYRATIPSERSSQRAFPLISCSSWITSHPPARTQSASWFRFPTQTAQGNGRT